HVIAISAQIALALYSAHSKGIVHRDMKPENILITSKNEISPFVKIVDFGISKIIGTGVTSRKERTLTKAGAIFGTPEYMSPEQAGGQQVDTRTDIYSLGVMMYEMSTGKLPFSDQNYMKVLHKHQYEIPDLPSSKEHGVPPEMDAIIMRCLEKTAGNRYPTMLDLLADLKKVYGQHKLEKQINLAFLLNSTVILRAEGEAPDTALPPPSERDMLRMLNQETMAGRGRSDTVAPTRKKSVLVTAVIILALLLVAGILFYRAFIRPDRVLVAERTPQEAQKPLPKPDPVPDKQRPEPEKKPLHATQTQKGGKATAKKTITLKVNSNLAGVTVVNNETGKVLCATPCVTKIPKDPGGVMVLGFQKDDFNIRPMAIALDRDITVNVDLKQN
ncbi:MAG TPA: protein kinase, partial [bacterium]|nr:protein kinase [bacterium]